MSKNVIGKSIVFIVGAGFNVDAASEAGYSRSLPSGRGGQYPLVDDLLKICFNREKLPNNFKSIEELFQDSINRDENKPRNELYEYLMELDYYITPRLKCGGNHYHNTYVRFLQDFPKLPLITFNYDSLLEILLLAEGSWFPGDGYGVPVQFQRPFRMGTPDDGKSLRHVLHLHGSLCVYTKDFFIENQPGSLYPILQECKPKFLFDPYTLGECFFPFERIIPDITYTHVIDRVIAPIPNKAEGLKGEFIKAIYDKAVEFLINANQIVVIGYSFNPYDCDSYTRLLVAMADKPVLLVAPDASPLIERLAHEYSNIRWAAQSMSFKEWVNNGYPGIQR